MHRPRLTAKVRRGHTLWKNHSLILQLQPSNAANPPSLPPPPSNLTAAARSDLEAYYTYIRDTIKFIEHSTTPDPIPEPPAEEPLNDGDEDPDLDGEDADNE